MNPINPIYPTYPMYHNAMQRYILVDEWPAETVFECTRDVIRLTVSSRIRKNLVYQFDRLKNSDRKISHTRIAQLCGASPETEKNWFKCGMPNLDALIALSEIFSCTLYDLINDTSDPWRYIGRPLNTLSGPLNTKDIPSFKATCKGLSDILRYRISKNLKKQSTRLEESGVKLSHEDIAKYCGVSSATVSRWFNKCTRLPGIDDLTVMSIIFDCPVYELLEDPDDQSHYIGHFFNSLWDYSYVDQMFHFIKLYISPSFVLPSTEKLTEMIYDPIVRFLVRSFFVYLDEVKLQRTEPEQLSAWLRQVNIDFNIKQCPLLDTTVLEIVNKHAALSDYERYKDAAKYILDHAEELDENRLNNNTYKSPSEKDDLTFISTVVDCPMYDLLGKFNNPQRNSGHFINSLQDLSYVDQMLYFISMYLSPSFILPSAEAFTDMLYNPISRFLVSSFLYYLNRVKLQHTTPEQLSAWLSQVNIDFNITPCPLSDTTVLEIVNKHAALSDYERYKDAAKHILVHAKTLTEKRFLDKEHYYYDNGNMQLKKKWDEPFIDSFPFISNDDYENYDDYDEYDD